MLNIETKEKSYFEFTLGKAKKVYRIPLAADLEVGEYIDLMKIVNTDDSDTFGIALAVTDFLRRYMDDKVDSLTQSEISAIFNAWQEECANSGQPVGE